MKTITNKFRVAFPNVFEKNEDGRYQVTMVFNDESEVQNIKDMIKAWADEEGINLKGLSMPFKYGDEKADKDEKYEDFRGKILVTPATWNKPGVVDADTDPILDKNEFYGGCYARASVTPRLWEYKKKKGIGLYLNNIQKMADGERFGGREDASSEFDVVSESIDI